MWGAKNIVLEICGTKICSNRPSKTKSREVHHFYSPIQIDIRLQVRIDLGLLPHKSIIQSPLAERKALKADGEGSGRKGGDGVRSSGKAATKRGAAALRTAHKGEAARPR